MATISKTPLWLDGRRGAFCLAREHTTRVKIYRLVLYIVFVALLSSSNTWAETMTPLERVSTTSRGKLKSPYANIASVADEGRQIYRSLDCGGCHGGGGGGGMAAPLTNEVWIYGNDDDTLFRLITLGTGSLSIDDGFTRQGFVRKGSENVVGPMPPYGKIVNREEDIWKIIAWIRSQAPRGRGPGT